MFLFTHDLEKQGEDFPLVEENALYLKLKKLVIFQISLMLLFLETFWRPCP